MHSKLCVLVFLVAFQTLAQPKTEIIESCIVVRLRDGKKELDVRNICRNLPKSNPTVGVFSELYSWAPDFLALAFDNAERGHAGSIAGVTRDRSVVLVLVPNGAPDAYISLTAEGMVLVITSGFLDFTEGLTGGFLIDAFSHGKNENFRPPPGMGYEKWLETMRGFGANNELAKPPWPGPDKLDVTQFVQVRALSQVVYQFLFAHELAHIVLNGPASERDPLKKETACDQLAFSTLLKFLQRSPKPPFGGATIPVLIVNFMIGVQYYELVKGSELGRLFQEPGKELRITSIFPARDWRARANAIIKQTRQVCKTDPESWLVGAGWQKLVDYAERVSGSVQPGEAFPASVGGEEFATNFNRLISASFQNFEAIKGKARKPFQGVDLFDSRISLPEEEYSQIRVPQNGGQALARCVLLLTEDRREAEAKFDQVLNALRKTVPLWWEFTEKANPLPKVEKRVLAFGDELNPSVTLDLVQGYEVSVIVWAPAKVQKN